MQKTILIGNGPSALSKKLGKEIDEFDTVVRFNTYRIEGFEEYVGTKTDIWVTTDIFPAWHKDYKEVILCSYNRREDNRTVLKMKEYYPQAHNFPEWSWQETIKLMGFSAPSSGAVAAVYFKNVYIYGFDFFAGDRHHYGDKIEACHHNAKYEMEYFRKLITGGKIISFHNYLKDLNYKILHKIYPSYGVGGNWYRDIIIKIAKENGVKTILDYGCGKGSLVKLLEKDFDAYGYDPYIPEYSQNSFTDIDMVVSTDFFEHIENIDEVCEHIKSMNPKVQFHSISNRKASQILPDGRNAHLTIQSPEWWEERLGYMGEVEILGHNENNNFTMYKIT